MSSITNNTQNKLIRWPDDMLATFDDPGYKEKLKKMIDSGEYFKNNSSGSDESKPKPVVHAWADTSVDKSIKFPIDSKAEETPSEVSETACNSSNYNPWIVKGVDHSSSNLPFSYEDYFRRPPITPPESSGTDSDCY